MSKTYYCNPESVSVSSYTWPDDMTCPDCGKPYSEWTTRCRASDGTLICGDCAVIRIKVNNAKHDFEPVMRTFVERIKLAGGGGNHER